MKGLRIFLGLMAGAFALEGAALTFTVGLGGLVDAMFANPVTQLMVAETVALASFVAFAIWRDAREQGINPAPYIALTLLAGPVGPLAYSVVRLGHEEPAAQEADERVPLAA